MTCGSAAACAARSAKQIARARSWTVLLAVGMCTVAVGIAGCGGSTHKQTTTAAADNGVAAKSPDAIVAAAATAARSAKSVHVSGSIDSGGMPISLDMSLVTGKGGSGRMSLNGESFRIIVVDQKVYINGSDAFWQRLGGSAAVQLFRGKWLTGPISGQFGGVAQLTDVTTLFNKLLSSHGTLAKGATSTIGGQKVIAVRDTTKGGTLYVATTGNPYPIQISGASGGTSGRMVFDRYNQPVSLSAPANAVDVSKLRASS